jgi:hypothetical protein
VTIDKVKMIGCMMPYLRHPSDVAKRGGNLVFISELDITSKIPLSHTFSTKPPQTQLTNQDMQAQQNKTSLMATASANAPGLLQQVAMAGGAAVITVSFIHPIDVIKVSVHFDGRSITCAKKFDRCSDGG